jgi:hypothetical protein
MHQPPCGCLSANRGNIARTSLPDRSELFVGFHPEVAGGSLRPGKAGRMSGGENLLPACGGRACGY